MSNSHYNTYKKLAFDLLEEYFDGTSLDDFCFKYFEEVESEFGQGFRMSQKVTLLIKYCKRTSKFNELIENIIEERPNAYQKYKHIIDRLITPLDDSEKQKSLYDYFINFPAWTEVLTGYFIRKRENYEGCVLLAHGASKEIPQLYNYVWFAKHILKENVKMETDAIPPKVLDFTLSTVASNSQNIAQEIILHLKGDRSLGKPLLEHEINKELRKLLQVQIDNGISVIIPYKWIHNRNAQLHTALEEFIHKHWQPVIDELKKNRKNTGKDSLPLLAILVEVEDKEQNYYFGKVDFSYEGEMLFELCNHDTVSSDTISLQIDHLKENEIIQWLRAYKGYFKQHKCHHLYNQSFLPPCRTMEGLFEKITPQVFPNLTFPEFLKSFKTT